MVGIAAVVVAAVVVGVVVSRSRRQGPGRNRTGLSVLLLELCGQLTGPGRREWVNAMLAEYDSLGLPAERRHFARGCLLALIAAPASTSRGPSLVRGAVALCSGAAAGLAAFGLIHYPGLRSGSAWIFFAALFAVGIAAYALAGAVVAKFGTSSVHRIGVIAAAPALPCAWFVAYGTGTGAYGVDLILALLPASAALWVARRDGSAACGVVAAVDTALLSGLLFFVCFVWTTFSMSTGTPGAMVMQEFVRSGSHDFRTWSIADSLGGACFMLVFIPVIGLVLAVLASLIATFRPRPSAPRMPVA